MSPARNNSEELSGTTSAKAPKSAAIGYQLVACLLAAVLLFAECPIALSQSPATSTTEKPDASATEKKEAAAQTPASTNPADQDSQGTATQQTSQQGKPKDEKRGSFVLAPIPMSSPAFGSGLILIVAYVFKFDKDDEVSPPSWVGAAGAFTNNGTRALAIGTKLYLKENRYQTTLAVMKGRANLDFYGVGRIPGRPAIAVPLSMGGSIFFGEVMKNIGKNIFIGPRYQFRKLTASIDGSPIEGGFEVPEIDLRSNSAALGFHLQRDRRNSTFYATKGSLLDFTADFFDQVWGSRRQYQNYKIAYNEYHEVKSKQVLAYRVMACSSNGNVPFYDLCLYGFNSDVRGYTTGQFQNRRMFAGQAEYRVDWRKRFGFTAFGGVGGVARNWGDFRMDGLLPGAGAGLRFKLDKKNHINYRVDFAFGREGRTLSIGVGEAF